MVTHNLLYNQKKSYNYIDNAKIQAPILSATPSEIFDKYIVTKPDHSFYREATIEKFIAGFGIGYLILRELPVRNFYARCFIMQLYAAKLFDHTWSIFPYNGNKKPSL